MIALVAMLAAAAAWLFVTPSVEPRLRRLLATADAHEAEQPNDPARLGWLASIAGAVGAWVLLGGLLGAVVAVACLAIVPRALRRLESRGARETREALDRQAPLLADLLSATLATGATMRDALQVSSEAVGSPSRESIGPVVVAIDLGADPATAWTTVGVPDAHRAIVDAVARAQDSGAPISALLARVADDLRRERRREVEVAARSAGVRAVAPLAACFLPAFLLVGVVPVIASLAGGLLAT